MSKPAPINVVIRNEQDARRAWACIVNAKASAENPVEVFLRPFELTRNQAQSRLYWVFVNTISRETGQDPESVHMLFKERFLIGILCQSDERLAEHVQAVKQLRREGRNDQADRIKGIILQYISTTSLKVSQFTDYIDHVVKFGADLGIILETDNQ